MTRPLTVVQLLPALHSGGVERSTVEIAQALVAAGHRAVVVSAGGRLVPSLLDCGAQHVRLDIASKSPWTLRNIPALRRVLTDTGADIVHARSRLPAWLGWWALRGLPATQRAHFVTTVHGLNSPSRYSQIMVRGERVICVSEPVRDHVCKHYPDTDPARLLVIPRGIDLASFPPDPHRLTGAGIGAIRADLDRPCRADPDARAAVAALHQQLGGSGPLLLLPGRGTRLKGHHDALMLLGELRRAGMDARLWMPGAREPTRMRYIAELEAQAVQTGCAQALAITAPTSAIAQAYAASDLVLQLSRKPEAFGRTVLEALAIGRPVLGWAHGGVGELLCELYPAGAVAPFDAKALVRTAVTLLQHPPSPPATIPYTLQAMQRATLAVYSELVNRP